MDNEKICRLVKDQLQSIDVNSILASFEDDDCIRLEIVSNNFKGMRVVKRIELLSEKLQSLAMNELKEYSLIFNPLTVNEKFNGISETLSDISSNQKNSDGIAAQASL